MLVSVNWTGRGAIPVVKSLANEAVGGKTGVWTTIYAVLFSQEMSAVLFALWLTVNVPTTSYTWRGLWVVLVFPSPKSQYQDVAFVEMSVNWTTRGGNPVRLVPEKSTLVLLKTVI